MCAVSRDVLGPYEKSMDYLFLGGERQTLLGLTKRCAFLRGLAPITMKRVLDVRRPGLNALQHVEEEVWKSRVLVVGAYVAAGYCAVQPPSTARGMPVTKEASSEAR